jgi:hypothetical protein
LLVLNDHHYIGQGAHRTCYCHPKDNSLCIKIPFEQSSQIKPLERELAYYKRLDKRDINWSMLSRMLGQVETNKGSGHIYTVVRDDDNEVSKNLLHYLKPENLPLHFTAILETLKKLYSYLLNNQILPLTLYPRNIVIKLDSLPLAVIVDDIGNNELIRFSEWSKSMAKSKISRKWQRFLKHLRKENENTPMVLLLLEELEAHYLHTIENK